MDFKQFSSTWTALHASNRFLKFCCVFLMLIDLVAMVGWLKKDHSVILVPPAMSEQSEITRNTASQSYKKAWAMFVASLLGNVTPQNADFVLASIGNMVSGEIRQAMTEQIAQELEVLKQERVTSTFEIRQILYEPETDKAFVSGRANMVGAGGKSKYIEQTFEFKIDVKGYAPVITHVGIYQGGAKTVKVVAKEHAKQAAQPTQRAPQP